MYRAALVHTIQSLPTDRHGKPMKFQMELKIQGNTRLTLFFYLLKYTNVKSEWDVMTDLVCKTNSSLEISLLWNAGQAEFS